MGRIKLTTIRDWTFNNPVRNTACVLNMALFSKAEQDSNLDANIW